MARNVLVTGGAGYVGSALVPRLLELGHTVTVLDLFIFGHDVLAPVNFHPRLIQVQGDLRNPAAVAKALAGCDSVIHLACISNDPSFELGPLARQVDQLRFVPATRPGSEEGRGRPLHLRLVIERLRHQGRGRGH